MVGAIRPFRFLQAHKKPLLVTVVVVAFFVVNLVAASAFRQTLETNGAIVETDKQVYMIGETVKTSIFFVNQKDSPVDTCINSWYTIIRSSLGPVESRVSLGNLPGPSCQTLSPGEKRVIDLYEWKAILPGTHTIHVSLRTPPGDEGPGPSFEGSTAILVVALR